jgi:hypothetical protein
MMNIQYGSIKEFKQRDMVQYLAQLGYEPQKISNQDYWYLSPLREEKTPSFKINRQLNVWYDHGIGKGGNLIDFGLLYFNCSIRDLLDRLSQHPLSPALSFHPPSLAVEKKDRSDGKVLILESRSLSDKSLLTYLDRRAIPLNIADRFCREVDFLLYGKKHTVIGFPNKAGGYELRSQHFKGSSSPKDISFIDNSTDQIVVFEGFFNFLSFQTINNSKQAPLTNCLVLNSLSFFEKSRSLMEKYKQIHLVLDNDNAGRKFTAQALQWSSRYIDRSDFYKGSKDLNDWLIHDHNKVRKGLRTKGP